MGGAFDGDRLVGACVGFFHAPAEDALHSHIAGVSAGATGRSIGFALKLHQRAWALLRGVSEIAWTFDPLVSRNAYFNLVKLAAAAGRVPARTSTARCSTPSTATTTPTGCWCAGGCATPRSSSRARARASRADVADELAAGASVALGAAADGAPVPGRLDGTTSLVAVPRDIEALRASDPALAQRWRVAVREALSALVADGGRIDGFDRAGWYVVRRDR